MSSAFSLLLSGVAIVVILANVLAYDRIEDEIAAADGLQPLQGTLEEAVDLPQDQSGSQLHSFQGEDMGQQYERTQISLYGPGQQVGMTPAIPGAEMLQPADSKEPYVLATPSSGDAPLTVTLFVEGMPQTPFWLWELDRDGDGRMDMGGQGIPLAQVVYDQPGSYTPIFTFFDENNQIIARASGLLTVTGQGAASAPDTLPAAEEINATPRQGYAPLQVLLDARQIAPVGYYTWSLDQYSGGVLSYPEGAPVVQVIYQSPGIYNATVVFYDQQLQEISRGRTTIIVFQPPISEESAAAQETSTGTQSEALKARPSGAGPIGGNGPADFSRDPVDLGDGSWDAPEERFTEDLKPQLYIFPERGSAPLTVRFDASSTFSRYGVYKYSYDIAWGPDNAPDDGYYLSSGPDPYWTHTFEEYGSYLVILDVEDSRGQRSRITKVVFILDPGLAPTARITANRTSGQAPLTVEFSVHPAVEQEGHEASLAYWDFDASTIEPMVGGRLDAYRTVVHTYPNPGDYVAGVTLADSDRNFGSMVRMAIHVTGANNPDIYPPQSVG